MVGWYIQGVEIVILGLDFGAVEHGETERREDVLNFRLYAADGMQMTAGRRRRGQREIDPFGTKSSLGCGFFKFCLPCLNCLLQRLFHRVQLTSDAGTLFGR